MKRASPSAKSPTRRSTSPTGRVRDGGDRGRQIVVAVSAAVAVVGTAFGVGAFGGTPIAEAGGGALSADATLIAPASPAFSIWTPIYAGLVGYAVWQLAGSRRADPRQRRVGWLVAATMLLNAGWILTAQAGAIWGSVAVIAVLLLALVALYARVLPTGPASRTEALLLDGTIGVYLGWVSIATVANVAAALVDAGAGGLLLGETAWAVILLVVAAAIGAAVAGSAAGGLPTAQR